jgi:hypothetical protein
MTTKTTSQLPAVASAKIHGAFAWTDDADGVTKKILISQGGTAGDADTIVARNASSTIAVTPTLTGSSGFALDGASGGVAITNSNNVALGGAATFSGLVIVNDLQTTGSVAVFLCGGSACVLIAASGTAEYSGTLGTASKINLGYLSTVLTLENKTGVTRTLNVMALRTRAHN